MVRDAPGGAPWFVNPGQRAVRIRDRHRLRFLPEPSPQPAVAKPAEPPYRWH